MRISTLFPQDCYELFLSQPFSLPYAVEAGAQEFHLQDRLVIEDICLALDKTPELALCFLSRLHLVACGDAGLLLADDPDDPDNDEESDLLWRRTFMSSVRPVKRTICACIFGERSSNPVLSEITNWKFGYSGRVVTGSRERVPKEHWPRKLQETSSVKKRSLLYNMHLERYFARAFRWFYNKVDQDGKTGSQVVAKVNPLKNIASKDSRFLESLVRAASITRKYEALENEVVSSVIEFKWKSYTRPMFRRQV